MNAVLEQINSIGKAFVEFAVPMLAQSSALIVILLLVDLALRKKVKAVFRYCIWMLVLLKLILPTSLSSPLSLGYWFGDKLAYVAESRTTAAPEAEVVEPALVDMLPIIEPVPIEESRSAPAVLPMMPDVETSVTEPVGPPVTWQGIVFLVWLAVVIALGLLLLQRAMFVRGLVAQAREANSLMNGALEYCCKCMGVKRKIGLKVSANAASPAVCGLFRPVILLPHKLAPSLGSSGVQTVLLHELAHIRRGDLWVNLVQTVLQIMYFYNPLLWLANCVIRRVREQAIDETVLVAMGEKAQQYPQTLVNVAKLAFKRPALSLRLIGVVESKSALAGRIKHILNRPMPKTAKLGILGLIAVIVVGCALLPMARKEPHIPPTSTIDASGRIVDKIDYAFVNDPAVIGTWKSVDFVRAIEDFESGVKHWPGDLYLKQMFIFEDGRTGGPWTWTKGLIIHPGDKTAARYHIKEIDGSTYMFFEWKSGDYTIRHMKPRYYVLKKVEKRISPEAAGPAIEPTDAKYVATLSNGVTVELVGVCEHPSEGKKWWRPNGIELSKEIRVKKAGIVAARGKAFAFVAKVNGPEDMTFKWGEIDGSYGGASLEVVDTQGQAISDMKSQKVHIDEKLTTTSIRMGVATGTWETKAEHNGKGIMSTGVNRGGIAFSAAYESDEGIKINVSDDFLKLDHRIIAIDVEGKIHPADSQPWVSAGKIRQTTPCFEKLSLNQIKQFKFQTRPYQWVTFKNVSLRPGNKTDVQVEVEGAGRRDIEEVVKNAMTTISTCAESDPRVSKSLESLKGLDENAVVNEVAKFLDSGKNTVRRSAIFILWRGSFKSIEPAAGRLQRLCSHEEEYTRGMAALALGAGKVESSFDTLCDMTLNDSSAYARRCAAYALGLMGNPDAKPVLEKALKDSDFNVRNNAEAALTMISQAAEQSTNAENLTVEAEETSKASIGAIDVAIKDFKIRAYEAGGLYVVTVAIQNNSNVTAPAFRLNFYRGDPADNLNQHGKPHTGSHGAGPIKPGNLWSECSSPFALGEGLNEISVVLDIDNTIAEADETNNTAKMKILVKDGRIVEESVSYSPQKGIGRSEVKTDVEVVGEGDKYNLMARGGKGRVEALDPNAANLIRRYLHALAKSDWKTALSMCSISVMDKAQQYPTPESFFNTVVPVKEILNKLHDPTIGYGTRPPKYFAYVFDVIISRPDMPRNVSWQWKARKLEGRANWEIDFPAIPFEIWLANAKQVIIRAIKEREQLIKEMGPRLKGVRTLLTVKREEFVVGEPIYFRLRLINQGDSILSYDCQQVAVNNSMTIEGPDGKKVKYTAELFQTLGGPVLLKPGETKTLFDQFDITKQYDIKQPGQYRVQFNGNGLWVDVGKEDTSDLYDPTSFKYNPGILPSNVVIITIHSGIKQETLDVGKDGVEGEKAVSQTNTEDNPAGQVEGERH